MRRVYMSFFARQGWVVGFLEADLKTPIGRIRTYTSDDTVRDLAERGAAFKTLGDRQAFDAAIENGRGGLYLSLTEDQYAKLKGR